MKKIAVIGSTGSIGRQALSVAAHGVADDKGLPFLTADGAILVRINGREGGFLHVGIGSHEFFLAQAVAAVLVRLFEGLDGSVHGLDVGGKQGAGKKTEQGAGRGAQHCLKPPKNSCS